MDVNFHYCAVKATDVLAGFSEQEAEIIATYSQYVDDYMLHDKLKLSNVPKYCKYLVDDRGYFHPVRTGFKTLDSISRHTKEEIIMPFHFVPKLGYESENYRTTKAIYHDNSLISFVLDRFAYECMNAYADTRTQYLIGVGAAAHVFADTYSHDSFNALNSNINRGKVTSAKDFEGIDRTGTYSKYSTLTALYPIGHANMYTAPDDSFLEFTFQSGKGTDFETTQSRTNWKHFANCAVELAKFFYDILQVFHSNTGLETIRATVENGCKVVGTDPDLMEYAWSKANNNFRNQHTSFRYNKPELPKMLRFDTASLPAHFTEQQLYDVLDMTEEEREKAGYDLPEIEKALTQVSATASDEFYAFNHAASQIRTAVTSGQLPQQDS